MIFIFYSNLQICSLQLFEIKYYQSIFLNEIYHLSFQQIMSKISSFSNLNFTNALWRETCP